MYIHMLHSSRTGSFQIDQDTSAEEDLTSCLYHETGNKLHLYINP